MLKLIIRIEIHRFILMITVANRNFSYIFNAGVVFLFSFAKLSKSRPKLIANKKQNTRYAHLSMHIETVWWQQSIRKLQCLLITNYKIIVKTINGWNNWYEQLNKHLSFFLPFFFCIFVVVSILFDTIAYAYANR